MQSVSDKRKFKYLFWYNFNTLDLFHKTGIFFPGRYCITNSINCAHGANEKPE